MNPSIRALKPPSIRFLQFIPTIILPKTQGLRKRIVLYKIVYFFKCIKVLDKGFLQFQRWPAFLLSHQTKKKYPYKFVAKTYSRFKYKFGGILFFRLFYVWNLVEVCLLFFQLVFEQWPTQTMISVLEIPSVLNFIQWVYFETAKHFSPALSIKKYTEIYQFIKNKLLNSRFVVIT